MPVGFADSAAQVVRTHRLQDQMDVVWHQAIGPDRDSCLQGLLGKQVEIDFVVAIFKEDGLAAVAALGDMVGKPWNHDTRQTCHVGTIARWGIGIMSPYFSKV